MHKPVVTLVPYATFGDLLKYLRLRARLTQRDLSIAVGYSEAQISRQESNRRVPGEHVLKALYIPALGLADEPETAALLLNLALKARSEALQPDAPMGREPLPQPAEPKTNLTAPLTSFIGREKEVSEVCQAVLQYRLVTLTGAGGVGKTRLALRSAGEMLEYFTDGAWLVELAGISDPALVPRAIADSLGVKEQVGQDFHKALKDFLNPRSLLLILDNCEHLLAGVATTAAELLRGCARLHILATSRAILGVEGEALFRCPSLSLPAEPLPALAAVAQSEAVILFTERSRLIWPDFNLTQANAAPVAQICRRLDGIPLAIELAAARTRMMSVEQIASRLDHAFALLTGGSRVLLPHHQTLGASIDWSYNLLSPQERGLLLRLSVFAGGWTLEAAEAICADRGTQGSSAAEGDVALRAEPDAGLSPEKIIDLLGNLIDKSLVQFEPFEGEPRYRMLETIRQYARGQLAESGAEDQLRGAENRLRGAENRLRGAEDRLRERHLDYFLALALQAEPHLRAQLAQTWMDRLDRELDNLRLALGWSQTGSVEKGLRLGAALAWFWRMRSRRTEGSGWLEGLLREQADRHAHSAWDQASRVIRGQALNALALIIDQEINLGISLPLAQREKELAQESLAIFQELGEPYRRDYAISRFFLAEIEADYLECRDLFQAAGDLFWMAACDIGIATHSGRLRERTVFYAEEGLALTQQIGDQFGQALAGRALGIVEMCRGNPDRAAALVTGALGCMETFGVPEWQAFIRMVLMWIAMSRGDYPETLRQVELIRADVQDPNNRWLLMEMMVFRAYVAWATGEYDSAVQYGAEALKIFENHTASLYVLGRVALTQGNTARARVYLRRVLQPGTLNENATHRAVLALTELLVGEGQLRRAATLAGAVEPLWGWTWLGIAPIERSLFQQAVAAARAGLGEEAFSEAWQAGRLLTLEQVRQIALECCESG